MHDQIFYIELETKEFHAIMNSKTQTIDAKNTCSDAEAEGLQDLAQANGL
jgi:hypothetical protein